MKKSAKETEKLISFNQFKKYIDASTNSQDNYYIQIINNNYLAAIGGSVEGYLYDKENNFYLLLENGLISFCDNDILSITQYIYTNRKDTLIIKCSNNMEYKISII